MPDSHLTRAGARIAYEVTGSGPPLAYAHGIFLSREAVRNLGVFDFEAVGRGRRMLTYDQRGHGHSTGRPVIDDYRFENLGDDLLELMDAAGFDEPMDMIGSSLGAATALHAALSRPDRFRRLVLMIPPVAWESGEKPARQWYLDAADAVEELGGPRWREQWAQQPPLPIFAEFPSFSFDPDIPDDLLPAALRGVGVSDLPAHEALRTLPHPTLVVTWDTDPLHPIATAETLAAVIPDATLHVAYTVKDVQTWTTRIADFLSDGT